MVGTIADVMLTDFPSVDSNATVAEAEEYFGQDGVLALPVMNPDRTVFGLLTPQNLAHFHQRPLNNPRAFHVWEICDARPPAVTPDMSLEEVAQAVLLTSGRHVLVINKDRELVGVITSELLVQHFVMPADTVGIEQAAKNPVMNDRNRRPS
jgi:CBS domain-containing protein